MKIATILIPIITTFTIAEAETDKPVHLFILSGQSNMQGMDPETGFMPEAKKLFKNEKVVYIKVAKGGQPICRWLEEWNDIAEKKGLDAKHRWRIHRDGKVEFYQPILDQYQEMLKKHPKLASVTFCWMQGERDANGGAHAAYKDALKLLISKLRRDLKHPDMNIVIGRIGDYALDRPSCLAVRKAQREIADEDPHGAWVDVDDLNDKEVKGKMQSVVHYNRPDGYITLGRRFARQGHALVTGKEPAEDGRPGHREPKEREKEEKKKEKKKKRAEAANPGEAADAKPKIGVADWLQLFDGKSFDGWHQVGGKHKYEVVDGMIVGTSVAGEGNAFMTTDETFQDFELKFEVRVDHRLNSGCQIRSVPVGKSRHLRGPQVEIDGGRSGFIYGEVMKKADGSPQKWLSPNLKDEKTKPILGAFNVDEWNSFLIRVLDDHYQTFVNGVPITDFKFDGMPNAGHIGLQVHGVRREDLVGKRVRWRNIQLRRLKVVRESDEATTDEEESAAVTKPGKQEEPLAFPYLATTEGREGYELAEEETNTYRVYDFYKRQAKHHLKQDRELKLLPAYPDLDGGTFGHWGNYNKNGHKDLRWNDMDYGPALAATYSIDKKKKIGGMLSVRLPGGHTVTFNKDTGGYYNAWEGRPYFNPHRWGLIHGVAVPEGVTAVDLSSWFAPISKDGASMSRYLGHYLHGRRVITHYEIGKTRFLDSVSRMGNGCYTRTITATQAGAVTIPFDLKDQWGIKTVGQSLIATKDGVVVAAKSFSKGTQVVPMREGGKWKSPANSDAIKLYFYAGSQVEAVIAAIKADRKLDPLQEWTGGGKSNWPERFKEQVSLARNDKAYVVDRIGVPFKNPWASMMMFSGIAFDKDGVAYLTTLMGDVWKVSGLGADTKEVTWKRFATGLNQPFGIRVIDGLPYVLTRGSIVCLKDLNADDEADYYEDNFNGFSYSPSAHTHTFGFPMDKDRAAYFVSGGGAYKKPWNQPVELLASGLRNAMAVGASREGVFLVGPQEGVWTPSSAVLEIQKGDYYGMGPNKVSKGSGAPAEITPAMAYLPRGIDNSTGGFEFPESDRFGPLNGKIIGLSYGYGSWFQILRNDGYADYGRAQGAIVPLAGEFRSGVVRGAVHPGDGMFYVVGTDGWGNYALEDGSLERIRYTGKSFPMLENVHGYENGIELQFSSKLSGNAAASTENYFVQQWNYEYSPAYGSLEFSVRQPAQEGHDRLKVTRAKILPDGKSVFLEIPDLLPALQTHIYADLKTADGPLEVNTFATLVHLDKAKPGFAEPLPELKSRTASLRVRSMKTANERVAGNTANTLEGRIRAGENMFKLFCTGCHGPQGQGLPNIGPTLNSDWVAGDPAALVKALLHGLTGEIKVNGKLQHFEAGMPAFGEALGDYEIAAILSFVRSRWSDDKAGVPIEFVRKVRADEKGKTGPYQAKDLWKTANAKPKTSVGESWVVDSQADWTAARGAAENVKLADGFAEPKADKASFQSVVRTFPTKRKLSSVVFEQSPVWDNWEQIDDITPQGAGNAYVFLPVAPGNYYFFATRTWPKMEYPEGLARNKRAAFRQEWNKKHPRGYHAWHSTDLKDWKHLGLVCPSSCMTTAEYADGKFYLYYDNPNDENPHLIIDDDLTDGVLGKDYGEVFSDPSHGSDAGIFRDEDGTFHMIYEDWSPINARENGWDSPLAGRVSSLDGIKGFKYGEHPPAVDHRTKPTGKIGTFTHPAMKISNDGKPLEYEIHEPRQNAYGDWTLIKVGSHYHLFGDYDSADHNKPMRMARFHTDDLNKEFKWSGEIGKGFHPDPSVGFAEGKFYVIIQRATDFVSPGPWVDGVEARAGVDKDGDGTIDEWTDWQAVKESYSQKSGFARIVDVAPARVGTDKLPAGQGFAFEYRTSRLDNGVQPIMDRVTLEFDKD